MAILLMLAALCGLLEKYFALRVALDAALFQKMAEAGDDLDHHTQALDQGLIALGLIPAQNIGRGWQQRSQGALRLLRNQTLSLLGQFVIALIAVAVTLIA